MPDQTQWQTISASHPALPGHFPGNPIVPGVVLLSQVWEAVCRQAGTPLHCAGWPSVKFLAPLWPGVPFKVEVEFGATQSAKFVCRTADNTIAQGSVRFAAVPLFPGAPSTHPHPNLPLEGEGTIAHPPAGGMLEGIEA